jgi:rhamnogalacturonan endolyase
MQKRHVSFVISIVTFFIFWGTTTHAQRQMEALGRGVVAVRSSEKQVFISWRLLGTEPVATAFNIYRKTGEQTPVRLNKTPLTTVTWFIDSLANLSANITWQVKPLLNGKELIADSSEFILPANTSVQQYLSVPIQPPPGSSVMNQPYTFSANDASVGDLNGDGEYELILKWEPSNAKNPPQPGFTGPQIIDAYTLTGKLLWRIDLGKNIRSGAAYTQLLVYDLDGDGRAEVVCKTADGTIDGKGKVIGDSTKDWRTYTEKDPTYGKIVNGPEYLTVFDGLTGAALATSTFIPDRYPLNGWGGIGGNGGNDNNGGRADRYTAGIAYLDGVHPSVVFVRGWYGCSVLAAWDFRNGQLTNRWVFDSKDAGNPYSGMGNHSLTVGDVDGDGKDEICIGAMTIDDDGKGLYTTGLRHGDALHMTDMDPDRPGMEVFGIHESEEKTLALQTPGVAMFDAKNGNILFSLAPGVDVGRGVSADIDPTHKGFENWGGPGGLRDVHGKTITEKTPSSSNFVIWWDGDLTRELLDKNRIDKWDWKNETTNNLLTAEGCFANNGTKATPCLSADLFGDWREEVIWRTSDNKELRIYTTTIPTTYRFYTLMHDPQYRLAIAWQNVSYNQPPHPGFYLGEGMTGQPTANISAVRVRQQTDAGSLIGGTPIYSDNFSKSLDLHQWIVEVAPEESASVYAQKDKLVLDTKGGVTVWLNQLFKKNIRIEYDRKVVVAGGVNDRLSDLNNFWMATDPHNKDLFTRKGVLESYDSLQLYYAGMGGNTNRTTRFRKYEGNGERKLLQEFSDAAHLLQPNKVYHIAIVVKNGVTSYWVDGQCYFSYSDPSPLKEGYFGFRSTKSHQEVSQFKVFQLE